MTHHLTASDVLTNDSDQERRSSGCFGCRSAGGKIDCIGTPVCSQCHTKIAASILSKTLDCPKLLIYQHLTQFRRGLFQEVKATSADRRGARSIALWVEFVNHEALAAPTLHFLGLDLGRCWSPGASPSNMDTTMNLGKGSATTQHPMDIVIRDGIWGHSLWAMDGYKYEQEEKSLWDTTRFFVGYHSLIKNLGSTRFQPGDANDDALIDLAFVEFVCAALLRIQFWYGKLMPALMDLSNSVRNGHQMTSVKYYCFEIILNLTKPTGEAMSWTSDPRFVQHLAKLNEEYNLHIKQIHDWIKQLQCRFSGQFPDRRVFRPLPLAVDIARGVKAFTLGRPCRISAQYTESEPWRDCRYEPKTSQQQDTNFGPVVHSASHASDLYGVPGEQQAHQELSYFSSQMFPFLDHGLYGNPFENMETVSEDGDGYVWHAN